MATRSEHWHLIRKKYEFSKETKIKALNRDKWQCVDCGIKKDEAPGGYLEIHHVVAIWFVANYMPSLSAALISSLDNAICLCTKCHEQRHRADKVKDYIAYAQALLANAS